MDKAKMDTNQPKSATSGKKPAGMELKQKVPQSSNRPLKIHSPAMFSNPMFNAKHGNVDRDVMHNSKTKQVEDGSGGSRCGNAVARVLSHSYFCFLMNYIVWNCRGTGVKTFPRLIKDLKREFKVDFLALLETHQSGQNAKDIMSKLGFDHSEVVEANGQSGGIWCLWNENGFSIQTVFKNSQLVHLKVLNGSSSWFLTVTYGSSNATARRDMWNCIDYIGSNMSSAWCVIGDFNAYIAVNEKMGGSVGGSKPDILFKNCLDRNLLMDLHFSVPVFTWKRGSVAIRLDRTIANEEWRVMFEEASVYHLPSFKSDHSSILVCTGRKATMCKPKVQGGLGMRHLKHQNQAFMTKLGWGLINQKDALWARVLRGKYKCGDDIMPEVAARSTSSRLWKGIAANWQHVKRGVVWRIGDGKNIRFWSDPWLPDGVVLGNVTTVPLAQQVMEDKIEEYVTASGAWDWDRFDYLLPDDICKKIASLVPPSRRGLSDRVAWVHSKHGDFSTKSAYYAIMNYPQTEPNKIWNLIWKWKGMERIRYFLWLCGQERLLTNVARMRRSLTQCDGCSRCGNASETQIHTLRDCPKASTIWMRLVHPKHWPVFFGTDFRQWFMLNLSRNLGREGSDWCSVFAIACWIIWKCRNAEVFRSSNSDTRDPYFSIMQLVNLCNQAKRMLGGSDQGRNHRSRPMVKWEMPEMGWLKVNVDGSRRGSTGVATCGGVARDAGDAFLGGFTCNLGSLAVNMVKQGCNEGHPCSSLVHLAQSLVNRDWHVCIHHLLCEGNCVADRLAAEGHDHQIGVHRLMGPPEFLTDLLLAYLRDASPVRELVL
ncbi:putative ribonuclease H protein At1g65750 family [Senna tora]|uniref:Putative ribonuclease H protein At1g65750 family n=2 Tax=Senna tora TaxID=362788 RepID=A0A835CD00_9FABA|nr:putative ribonuclease H protein At1g65750 family [Senna tora]